MSYEHFIFHRDRRALSAGQRAHDARMPEESSPMRRCVRCKKDYNSDTQELDSKGNDLCDTCIQAIDDENGPQI